MPGSKKSPHGAHRKEKDLSPDHRSTAPIRLLLVDDEKGFVDVLSKRLAKRNIHATQAFSGTEGSACSGGPISMWPCWT